MTEICVQVNGDNPWQVIDSKEFQLLKYNKTMESLTHVFVGFLGGEWYDRLKDGRYAIHPLVITLWQSSLVAKQNKATPYSVYIMEREDKYIKIGVAINVDDRKKTIERASGLELTVAYSTQPVSKKIAYKIESIFKRLYKCKQLKGEWFALTSHDAIPLLKQIKQDVEDAENPLDLIY
jgi:hypothetical protein